MKSFAESKLWCCTFYYERDQLLSPSLSLSFRFFTFHCMPLALASYRKKHIVICDKKITSCHFLVMVIVIPLV